MVIQTVDKRRNHGELLTVGQAAEMLNVHPNTVRRWTSQGLLTAYRLGPRGDRRFRRSEVMRTLNGNGY